MSQEQLFAAAAASTAEDPFGALLPEQPGTRRGRQAFISGDASTGFTSPSICSSAAAEPSILSHECCVAHNVQPGMLCLRAGWQTCVPLYLMLVMLLRSVWSWWQQEGVRPSCLCCS